MKSMEELVGDEVVFYTRKVDECHLRLEALNRVAEDAEIDTELLSDEADTIERDLDRYKMKRAIASEMWRKVSKKHYGG